MSLPAPNLPDFTRALPGVTAQKILFLGDSITQAGDYINFFECQMRISDPDTPYEIYNLGLASETISGLSEAAHPFPRPYLHDRLDKVLDHIQPDILFACYGINCGIYHPFAPDISTKYQQGIRQLISVAEKRKVQLILLTPPPYASTVNDWEEARADLSRNDYSYAQPYTAYDDVMHKYAEWILSLEEVKTIDIQTPMRRFQELGYGKDVIHPNLFGHQLMAQIILNNFRPEPVQQNLLEVSWKEANKSYDDELVKNFHLQAPANPHVLLSENQEYNAWITANRGSTLKIRDCPSATYQLFDQHFYLGQLTHDVLQKGINISPLSAEINYEQLSFVKKAQQLYDLIAAKREVCDYALLQHIGHQRPMDKKGLPIALAEEKRKTYNTAIQQLLEQRNWNLEIIRL